jgi:hypothetical protein
VVAPSLAVAPATESKPIESKPIEPKSKPTHKQKPELPKNASLPVAIEPDPPVAAAPPTIAKEKKISKAPASDLAAPPLLSEGSFWKYQRSNVWLNEVARKTLEETRILSVEPKGYRVMLQSGGLGQRERVFNKDGNQTYRVDGTAYVNQMYVWPMVIEKTWSVSRIYTSTKTSLKVAVEEKCKVVTNESVAVPAGQFKAVRIDCEGFETPQDQSSLRTETSHWYAPEALRFAKTSIKKWNGSTLTTSENLVLIEFSLK